MKKITSTITTTRINADFYNVTTESVERKTITKAGKFTGLDYKELPGYITCKVLAVDEPKTATYSMALDKFMQFATESDTRHIGFINRQIGGDVAVVLACDLDTLQNEKVEIPNGSERELKKACEEMGLKYIATLDTMKVDVKFYYMSQEDFTLFGEEIER